MESIPDRRDESDKEVITPKIGPDLLDLILDDMGTLEPSVRNDGPPDTHNDDRPFEPIEAPEPA